MELHPFKNWWLLGLKGLILFLLGLYTLFNTDTAADGLILFFGISAVLGGVSEIFLALTNRDRDNWGGLLGEGVLDLLIGIILLAKPDVANILPILIGIWILFSGISLLMRSLRGSDQPEAAEGPGGLWLGIVLIIVGLLAVINPFGAYQALMGFLGFSLLILGLIVMFVAWKLRGVKKQIGSAAAAVKSRLQDR